MVEGRPTHGTWKVGMVTSCGSLFVMGYFIWSSKMGASIVLLFFFFVTLV
jgi:hypothetical protein